MGISEKGETEREGKGTKTRNKMSSVPVPTTQDDCKLYALQTYINKS